MALHPAKQTGLRPTVRRGSARERILMFLCQPGPLKQWKSAVKENSQETRFTLANIHK
jgi:hypothetical protein